MKQQKYSTAKGIQWWGSA